MSRWIKLHESMTEWEWYQDPYVKGLFLHLLIKANYKDLRFKGKVIKRGQLVTSIRHLAQDLNYSDKTVRRCLEKLKKTHEIKVKATNQYTLITITNYEYFQGVVLDTTRGTTRSTTRGTHKYRNIKEEKNLSRGSLKTSHGEKKEKEGNVPPTV